jgi:predicted enzyme related to lactoylglutathione lyase
MNEFISQAATGAFCWVDLAATDVDRARGFYGRLFGWSSRRCFSNRDSFTCARLSGETVASIYQLDQSVRARGMPSHWTPYVRVDDIDAALARVARLGGQIIVGPTAVSDTARAALIFDPVGAHVGLWQAIRPDRD